MTLKKLFIIRESGQQFSAWLDQVHSLLGPYSAPGELDFPEMTFDEGCKIAFRKGMSPQEFVKNWWGDEETGQHAGVQEPDCDVCNGEGVVGDQVYGPGKNCPECGGSGKGR